MGPMAILQTLLTSSSIPISSPQIISEASLNKAVINQLQNCPSDVYVLVSQPGVNAADFQDPFSAPYLRQKLIGQDEEIRSRLIISDVVGNFDSASLGRILQDQCGVSLLEVDASSMSPTNAKQQVRLMKKHTDNCAPSRFL